jgi:hypothetical protein
MVMMIAITPSLKASSLPLLMLIPKKRRRRRQDYTQKWPARCTAPMGLAGEINLD